ncbi:MAG: hypothetical protein KGI54_14505, partial [Pseudomonadota bacterium]|nr:hypothetical protein [Pseudomonadota bacterium]
MPANLSVEFISHAIDAANYEYDLGLSDVQLKTLPAYLSVNLKIPAYTFSHPEKFKTGTRVLHLRGRHKDGVEMQRSVTRASHSVEEFDEYFTELLCLRQENERIYASASARDVKKAIRDFKERQLENDYDLDPAHFYQNLNTRWVSALMQPTCQSEKFWLFDCDTQEDKQIVEDVFDCFYHGEDPYWYITKNGWHALARPFDLSEALRSFPIEKI